MKKVEFLCTNCCQYIDEDNVEEGICGICGEDSIVEVDEESIERMEEERQRGNVLFAMDIADSWKERYESEIHFPEE